MQRVVVEQGVMQLKLPQMQMLNRWLINLCVSGALFWSTATLRWVSDPIESRPDRALFLFFGRQSIAACSGFADCCSLHFTHLYTHHQGLCLPQAEICSLTKPKPAHTAPGTWRWRSTRLTTSQDRGAIWPERGWATLCDRLPIASQITYQADFLWLFLAEAGIPTGSDCGSLHRSSGCSSQPRRSAATYREVQQRFPDVNLVFPVFILSCNTF